jgi:hypothetical protein
MDDFIVIGERGGEAYVERVGTQVKVVEPIVLRYGIAYMLPPAQITMGLAPPGLDLPVEWQRRLPRFYWLNRFNSHCGCLLDDTCVEPHVCNQKIWVERSWRGPIMKYRGPHQHVL